VCARLASLHLPPRMTPRARPGFTLIETVFAIFIFAVGVLGLAATTAVIARSLAVAAARERSGRIGSAQLETLRSLSCGGQSGSESSQGFRSEWTVAAGTSGASIVERVTYPAAGTTRTDTYTAIVPCRR
jgi:Tfp pilus assembly protein PilV